LDLKTDQGREDFRRLARGSDVLIANWRPGMGARLGLADDQLAADNPRLIRLYVTGFGPTGPYADHATFDSVIQARSGLAWIEGGADGPRLVGGFLVDKLTASFTAQSALAALYERERTGRGTAIDMAMLDTLAYFDFPELFARRTFLDHQPADPRNQLVAANRPVRAKDGWVQCSAVTAEQIRNTMAAVDRPDEAADILNQPDGTAVGDALREHVGRAVADMTVAEAVGRLVAADVPAAPCVDPDGHLADEQVAISRLYEVDADPELGPVRTVRHPARSADWGRLSSPLRPWAVDSGRAAVLGPAPTDPGSTGEAG
jgi:crotonobetainyl-CoA:carnitine CoA-transferase CaiB-like acyl-CoA transferase